MNQVIGCVLCNYRDRDLLPSFIAAWEALDSNVKLVLLVDQDSPAFSTHGLATYPLLWEKNRRIALAPGVAASLANAAQAENASAVIKLDVDCIHRSLSWIEDNQADHDVIGFAHLADPECFFGAAYYITTSVLTDVAQFLTDKPHWGRAEDIGISKSVRDIGASLITLPLDDTVCGVSDAVEYKPHLFNGYSLIHCGEFTKSLSGRARVSYMMKRLNLYSGAVTHKRAVVYPIKEGNANDCNIELVMSLRSIEKNLAENVPVFILSEKIPPNLSGAVNFVKVKGYQDAVKQACDLADEILWMNDDIFLIRPHTWEDFRKWVKHGDEWDEATIVENETHGNNWRKRKGQVVRKLKDDGLTLFDYSSHTPYLYVTGLLKAVVREFDFGYKTAFETAYGNVARVSHRSGFRKLQRYHGNPLPIDSGQYDILNYSDKGTNDHVRGFLLGMFPTPSSYESHDADDLSTTLLSTIK